MIRRIVGIETEYGIMCAANGPGDAPITAEDSAQRIFAPVLQAQRTTNVYLPNGARLYLDVGAHPEYATAECDDLRDLLVNDRAGDEILRTMVREANEHLRDEGIDGRIHLFKNNLDSAGHSFGCHENYLVRRRRDYRSRIDSLIPYFVSRQILVGSGYINITDGKPSFNFSQRADQMLDAVSAASTRSRPMINTRDEPHGNPELYRRMHVIVGDSNMIDSTCLLKVGATKAVLDALESGVSFSNIELADPVDAIRTISRDLTGGAVVERKEGGTVTALDIQRDVYEKVKNYFDSSGLTDENDATWQYVFDLWCRVLHAFESDDFSQVKREIDWVAKQSFVNRYVDRLNVGLDDPKIARLDLAWHDVSDGGLRDSLTAAHWITRITTPEEVTHAVNFPPQTTRAKIRGDFIALAQDLRRDYMVDWSNVRLITPEGSQTVTIDDPFSAADTRVDQLMADMELGV